MKQRSLFDVAPPSGTPGDGATTPEQPTIDNLPVDIEKYTIAEARDYLLRNEGKKVYCPCCERRSRVYVRPMNNQMARFLISLYTLDRKFPEKRWFTSREIVGGTHKASSDGTFLRHWKLIEPVGEKPAGVWGITQAGQDFVVGKIYANRSVTLFGDVVLDWDEDTITLQDALGTGFDYLELMAKKIKELGEKGEGGAK